MSDSQRLAPRSQDVYGIPWLRLATIDYITRENPGMARGNPSGGFSVDTNCAQFTMIADSRNRDRGKPRGFSSPTPPDMRVRIRRFGELGTGQRSISEPRAGRNKHWAPLLEAVHRFRRYPALWYASVSRS